MTESENGTERGRKLNGLQFQILSPSALSLTVPVCRGLGVPAEWTAPHSAGETVSALCPGVHLQPPHPTAQ